MFERAYAVSSISAFRESLHDNMLALRSEGRGNDFAVPVGLFLVLSEEHGGGILQPT